jgi:glycosyltransferase involved in cell wall biosynthesis
VARWLAACDVFCLPSHSEGCPNVVLEAIACGRPVVATTVGGIPEVVNEQCGVLVPPGDIERLRGALAAALEKAWCAERISAQFRRSWEQVAEETYNICREVLATNADG